MELMKKNNNIINLNENFGVDAGVVGVIDERYLSENGGVFTDISSNKKINIEPGKYRISFWCEDTWRGEIIKSCEIETCGSLIFGDPCYLFPNSASQDHWMKFLNKTDYLRIPNEKYFCVDTGGDGEFNFSIQIEKI